MLLADMKPSRSHFDWQDISQKIALISMREARRSENSSVLTGQLVRVSY